MGKITAIECIHAREILDSRGNPTIETEITLANGVKRYRLGSVGCFDWCL